MSECFNICEDYVDVHGNPLNVITDSNNVLYVSMEDVQKTGFHFYPKRKYNFTWIGKETVLSEFQLHLLGAGKDYLIKNHVDSLTQDDILETIELCRQKLMRENFDNVTPSASGGNQTLGRTLLSDPNEINRKVRNTLESTIREQQSAIQTHYKMEEMPPRNNNQMVQPKETVGFRPQRTSLPNAPQLSITRKYQSSSSCPAPVPLDARLSNSNSRLSTSNTSLNNANGSYSGNKQSDYKHRPMNGGVENPFTYKKLNLSNNVQKTKIVHVQKSNDKEKYWVILSQQEDELNALMEELLDVYNKCMIVQYPKLYEVYLARASDDLCYRVCITQNKTSLKVLYIDYGNEDYVKEVRQLPDNLKEIPAFATRVTVSQNEDCPLKITLKMDQEIALRAVKEYPDGTALVKLDLNEVDLQINQEVIRMQKIPYQTKLVDKDIVKISGYENGVFYVKNKAVHEIFIHTMNLIREMKKTPLLGKLELDQMVLTKKQEEEEFYRAVVRKIEGDHIKIQFVDCYETTTVKIGTLMTITKAVANLPVGLIKSPVIHGYKPNIPSRGQGVVEKLISTKEKVIVQLSGSEFDLLYKEQLLSELIFPQIQPVATASPPTAVYVPIVATKSISKKLYTDMESFKPPMGVSEYMLVDYISPSEFVVVALTPEASEILTKCTSIPVTDETPYTPDDCEMVLVKYNDEWYRGSSFERNGDNYQVCLVDYGNLIQCTPADIRQMPEKFQSLKMLGLSCTMDVPQTSQVLEKLQNIMTITELFNIEFISYDSESLVYTVKIPKILEILQREKLL